MNENVHVLWPINVKKWRNILIMSTTIGKYEVQWTNKTLNFENCRIITTNNLIKFTKKDLPQFLDKINL